MKSFKFDPKTGRFEFCLKCYLSEHDIKVLKHITERGYGGFEELRKLFANVKDDDDGFQLSNHSLFYLDDFGLVEFKAEQNVCVKINKKNYRKSKWEKKQGYFLTTLGKAFVHSLGFKPLNS